MKANRSRGLFPLWLALSSLWFISAPLHTAYAQGVGERIPVAALSYYRHQVFVHLLQFRRYPREALRRRLTGVAHVRFSLGRDGRVLALALKQSSGERILDEAALDTVRRAAPFPWIPSALSQMQRANFTAPIAFRMP